MHPAGRGIDVGHQAVRVGGFQLRQLPPFQHAARHLGPLLGQRLQHGGVRAPGAAAHPPAAGQLHLVEQDLAQHLRTAQVERAPGEPVDVRLHHGHALTEIGGQSAQFGRVDHHPGPLHRAEHGDEPPLQLLIQRHRPIGRQARAQGVPQPDDAVGGLRDVGGGALGRHQRQDQPGAAGAGDLVQRGRRVPEMQPRQILQPVGVGAGFLRVGDQHHVIHRRRRPEPGGDSASKSALASWNIFSTDGSASTGSRIVRATAGSSCCTCRSRSPWWASGT